MHLRFETPAEKKLVGKRLKMSFAENKTFELWRAFMPRRRELENALGAELYSIEVYESGFHDAFDPHREFEKWAAAEVADFTRVPDEMECLTIPAGLYAVFLHQGPAREGEKTYRYIFENWLPQSGFTLDDRPHFAVMGEKYKADAADSEEEVWIPVKRMEKRD
jgi:AraC family transcriptional regulator